MKIKTFFAIINTTFQRSMTYRFSIVAYRVGEIMENLILILMWASIYKGQEMIQGYTVNQMTTYVLVGFLVNTAVRNFLTDFIANEIKEGKLSSTLLKPISYIQYSLVREVGRLGLPLIFSFFSQAILILFFLDRVIFNTDWKYLTVMIVMVFLAFITELLFSFLVGLMAFWIVEVDGVNATIARVKRFFSGGYFPLSLLPIALVKISFILPFSYSFFVPTQLYLKKISPLDGLKGVAVQIVWIFLLYFIIKFVWKRGLIKYESVGI